MDLPEELKLAEPINGRVRLIRTNRGVLARRRPPNRARGGVRPLPPPDSTVPLELTIEEEFLPSLDLATGKPVSVDEEPEALRLTDHHELDLEPSVRDAISLAEPIAPLDRPDCPGLCVDLRRAARRGHHDHPDDDIDPRLEALTAFKADAGADDRAISR